MLSNSESPVHFSIRQCVNALIKLDRYTEGGLDFLCGLAFHKTITIHKFLYKETNCVKIHLFKILFW
jgi:hypothetical protein